MNKLYNKRIVLHFILLIYAILISNTLSIIPFIIPIIILAMAAGYRNNNSDFDIIDMFWLLAVLFFVVSPSSDFTEYEYSTLFNYGVIVHYPFFDYIYTQSQLITMYFIIFIGLGISFLILPKRVDYFRVNSFYTEINPFIAQFVLVAIFILIIFLNGGIANTLASRFDKDYEVPMYAIFVESFYLFFLFIYLSSFKKNMVNYFSITFLLLLHAILYNPFNTPRFELILAWLPVIVILFPFILKFHIFMGGILFGMIVLMPILSLTSRFGSNSLESFEFSSTKFLLYMDVHTILLHTIEYVEKFGYALGSSILSVILFFIPRSLWESKPDVIGLVIGGDLYRSGIVGTDNLSGPILADFYYDFGLIGVAMGSILFAYLFRYLIRLNLSINNTNLVSIILLASLPILFRGSLGAVIGLPFFILLFLFIFWWLKNKIRWQSGS